jgi:cobalt-zinc-cadmium efflux system outer membrane protein
VVNGHHSPNYVSDLKQLSLGSPSLQSDRSTGPASQRTETEILVEKPWIELNDLLRLADLNHPGISVAWDDIGAAAGRMWQADLYPNPVLELEIEDIPARSPGVSHGQNTISITQPIVLSERRSAAFSAATAEKNGRVLALEQKRREVLGEVRILFVELLYLSQAEALHGELLELARQTLNIAKTRFEAKAAPEFDVIKPAVEVHNLELTKRGLGRRREATAEGLSALLGGVRVPTTRLQGKLSVTLPRLDLDRLKQQLRERHPEILVARKELEAVVHRLEQANAERVPDLGLRLAYGRNTADNENIIEFGMSIPLPLFNQNQGKILETQFLATRAKKAVQVAERRLLANLATVYADYMTACDESAVFHNQIVPAAERALSQTRYSYQAGKSSLLDLLDAQRTLTETRLSYLAKVRDWNLAHATLWKILGPFSEDKLNGGNKP